MDVKYETTTTFINEHETMVRTWMVRDGEEICIAEILVTNETSADPEIQVTRTLRNPLRSYAWGAR